MPVSSKGQVSIPIAICEQVGLMPNTEVEFDFDGRYVRIRRARRNKGLRRGAQLIEHLRTHGGDVPMTTGEIMALMRGK